MKKYNFTFRDLIAVPFFLLFLLLGSIAIHIGGAWTASYYVQMSREIVDKLKSNI